MFSDKNGVLNLEFPQNLWENTFVPVDHKVRVDMLLTYDSLADLEAELEMGFKEGMTVESFLLAPGSQAKQAALTGVAFSIMATYF